MELKHVRNLQIATRHFLLIVLNGIETMFRLLCPALILLLLIVLNGIETDSQELMQFLLRLLIVLNGIETLVMRMLIRITVTFNRTKWN